MLPSAIDVDSACMVIGSTTLVEWLTVRCLYGGWTGYGRCCDKTPTCPHEFLCQEAHNFGLREGEKRQTCQRLRQEANRCCSIISAKDPPFPDTPPSVVLGPTYYRFIHLNNVAYASYSRWVGRHPFGADITVQFEPHDDCFLGQVQEFLRHFHCAVSRPQVSEHNKIIQLQVRFFKEGPVSYCLREIPMRSIQPHAFITSDAILFLCHALVTFRANWL